MSWLPPTPRYRDAEQRDSILLEVIEGIGVDRLVGGVIVLLGVGWASDLRTTGLLPPHSRGSGTCGYSHRAVDFTGRSHMVEPSLLSPLSGPDQGGGAPARNLGHRGAPRRCGTGCKSPGCACAGR